MTALKLSTMKKLLVLALLGGLLGSQQCLADSVNVTQNGGYFNDGGGEFTITDPPSDPFFDAVYANYAAVATLNGGFQTFCISTSIHVLNGGNSLNAILDPHGIAVGTAWLYAMFAMGTLPDYNYDGSDLPFSNPNSRGASAYQLQNAIWELQGQSFDPNQAAFYVGLAVAGFGSFEAASALAVGPVDGLSMTFSGSDSQPMLAFVGAPDSGATLTLLGLGLGCLAAFSRRFRS